MFPHEPGGLWGVSADPIRASCVPPGGSSPTGIRKLKGIGDVQFEEGSLIQMVAGGVCVFRIIEFGIDGDLRLPRSSGHRAAPMVARRLRHRPNRRARYLESPATEHKPTAFLGDSIPLIEHDEGVQTPWGRSQSRRLHSYR